MGLEEIIKSIELDTRARTKRINDQALIEARRIRDEAEDKAREYIGTEKEKSENDAKLLTTRESSRANIDAKAVYQKAVNAAIDSSFDTLQQNLTSYVKSADYVKLLAKLAKLATDELGNNCTIFLQSGDVQRLKTTTTLKESDEEFVGGLRALSKDGKRYVDYSLEKIVEVLREGIAVKLLDLVKE